MLVDEVRWQRLLTRQDGVVTTAQALSCGFTRSAVHHRVASGRWQRVAERVLVTSSGPPSARQLLRAGLLAGGPHSALTGPTACRLLGLHAVPDERVHVAVPRSVRRPASGWLVPHPTTRPFVPLRADGLPVVPAARAVVDTCLALTSLGSVRALVAEAVQRSRCTVEQLVRGLDDAPQQGSQQLRKALEEVALGARSRPEAVLLRALRRLRGLPPFELNADVIDDAGRWLARPDVVFRAQRLVAEVDGQRWHLSPERWRADVERHTRLEAAGWTVLRYPAAQVLADADGVAAEIAAVARRRAAA